MRSSKPLTARMSRFQPEALCPFQLARAVLTASSTPRVRRPAVSFRFRCDAGMPCARNQSAEKQRCARMRSEEHTSELQSLMRISYAVFCLKQKIRKKDVIMVMNKDLKQE